MDSAGRLSKQHFHTLHRNCSPLLFALMLSETLQVLRVCVVSGSNRDVFNSANMREKEGGTSYIDLLWW